MNSRTGLPTTFALTPRGAVPIVGWDSQYFSSAGYSPERRCQEVTGRFNNLHSQGLLSSITTGYLNGQPVVCASRSGGCSNSNLLFTLKPGSDAAMAVQKLFDLGRGTATGVNQSPESRSLYESSGDDDSGITIDLNNLLNHAAVEPNGPSSGGSESPNVTPSEQTEPSDGGGGIF